MYQQINLYQPVFRQQHKVFSARTLAQIFVAMTVLLLALYGHARWTLAGLQRTSAAMGEQYAQLAERLGALEDAGNNAAAMPLDTEVDQLQNTIAARKRLLEQFSQLVIDERPGFGDVFDTLARYSLPGLWLTGISLLEDGYTELRGTAVNARLVPRYLQLLPAQEHLNALNPGSVSLERRDGENTEVDFKLRSIIKGRTS
ncbi:MAG: hypothetical protein WBN51_03145 [Gammaproteobacteria bacterium]|jgi:hypothetical protein